MTQPYNLTYIIDDDPIFVLLFKKILSKIEKFKDITIVDNGKKALDLIFKNFEDHKKLPDVIFLDINMPILDGWQFLDKINNCSFKNDIQIYMVSSSIDKKEIEKAKSYGFVKNFIHKPIGGNFIEKISA